MELLFFCLLIFVSRARSQALLSVLQNHFELSTFTAYVNKSQILTSLLSTADNVTLFAPSNAAFSAWAPNQPPNLGKDQVEALLTYHLVHGTFPSLTITNQPQFQETFLNNITYANVTGGQRVELVSSSNGSPEIVSGNKTLSGITTTDVLFTGGLIQIIDTVLMVPMNFVILITQANFRYFVAILNAGGYLSPNDTPLVDNAIFAPSNTIFAPNTQEAVDTFNSLSATMNQEQLAAIFNYHTIPRFLGYSTELKDGMQLRTLQGTNLTVTIQGNDTYVNGARIITYDYLVCNGVVHMIDNVLNPANTTGPPLPSTTGSSNPATTTLTIATSGTSTPSSKSGWTTGAKAGLGIGIALLLISFSAGIYFLLRWLRHRTTSSESRPNSQQKKQKVVWNVGPKWMKRASKQVQRGGERGVSPQELEGEGKTANMGVASPGISESTVSMSERSGYERRIGSWGGELEGSGAKYQVVRGHIEES